MQRHFIFSHTCTQTSGQIRQQQQQQEQCQQQQQQQQIVIINID